MHALCVLFFIIARVVGRSAFPSCVVCFGTLSPPLSSRFLSPVVCCHRPLLHNVVCSLVLLPVSSCSHCEQRRSDLHLRSTRTAVPHWIWLRTPPWPTLRTLVCSWWWWRHWPRRNAAPEMLRRMCVPRVASSRRPVAVVPPVATRLTRCLCRDHIQVAVLGQIGLLAPAPRLAGGPIDRRKSGGPPIDFRRSIG